MLVIDGAEGEGGGQVVRSAVALSLVTGTAFRMVRVRGRRARPGLQRQHLAAVRAAAEIGRADVSGATLGSREIVFRPGRVVAGDYRFDVGSAGSATLVVQTVLPPLLVSAARSSVTVDGGTHNPFAPPYDFLALAFFPLLRRMGARAGLTLVRPGFAPAGGGRLRLSVEPGALGRLALLERGPVLARRARAIVSALPRHVAERELALVRTALGWDDAELLVEEIDRPRGPGNILLLEVHAAHVTEVFTGFGRRGVRAEAVAAEAAAEAGTYLSADVPVGIHLADQLLLPCALAGGGTYRTLAPSPHSETNAAVIRRFLPVQVAHHPDGEAVVTEIRPAG